MGKESGSAPQPVDPLKVLPAQQAADKASFDYQTQQNRYNSVGPDSSTTWDKKSVFDQAGFDKANAAWKANNPQGVWVPPTNGTTTYSGGDSGDSVTTGGTAGYWTGTAADGTPAPNANDYTTYDWTKTDSLSPGQQQIHDLTQNSQVGQAGLLDALTQRLKGTYGNAFSTASAPALASLDGNRPVQTDAGISGLQGQIGALDPAQFNQKASDAVFNAQKGYFDEGQATTQRALEARLSEQGFVPGTPGYESAMNAFQDNQNQSLNQLRNQSTTQGFSVGNQQFGNSLQSLQAQIAAALQGGNFANSAQQQIFGNQKDAAGFQNTSRSQAIAELLQERQQPLNELNALRSGTQQVVGNIGGASSGGSSGGTTGGFSAPNVIDAYQQQYKGNLANYNAAVASDNADQSSAVGIISAIATAY